MGVKYIREIASRACKRRAQRQAQSYAVRRENEASRDARTSYKRGLQWAYLYNSVKKNNRQGTVCCLSVVFCNVI